ncbi:GNAT family N-acetyltransferase [Kribbella sp. NPDC056861]|uniref:GNAT family N-acetyltransferase n=1 Tax=Kribbella sp. NPDC056861 TaxID=3154857 RepID=UPI0034132AEB
MEIEERKLGDVELDGLLEAAFQELVRRYGGEGRSVVQEGARYLVASIDGQGVGCGALQPSKDPAIGELKRMFVAPEFRGRGIASAVLTALEELAAAAGYSTIRLATGVRQPEAIGLYERHGYRLTQPFGKYVGDELARCYQNAL